MPKDKLNSYLHLHLIVFIWGFTGTLGALISLNAISLVWYRVLFAVIFIYGFLIINKKVIRQPAQAILSFLIGGILIASHWIAFFYAIKIANVSITLAALSTGALFTSFLEPLFYKRKIVFYEIIFSLFAVVGLVLIFKVESKYAVGLFIALGASFLSALFSVVNSKLVQKYEPSIISFYELFFAVAFITIILVCKGSFSISFFTLKISDWVYLLILSSVCTAYAMVASTKLLRKMSPFTMMLTINLEPVYGIIIALLILGDKENMSIEFYFGATIILITVILNSIVKINPGLLRFKK